MATQNSALQRIKNAVDQVFLSPRVVDRSAFEEFAGQLRTLIEQAAKNAQAVEAASLRAVQVHAHLSETGPAMEGRISGAANALAAAEARALEAQGLLSRASQHCLEAQTFDARLSQIVAERVAAFESALALAAARHHQQFQAIEDDFRQRLAGASAAISSQLDDVGQRAHTLEHRTAEIADRLSSLSTEATATFSDATARLQELLTASASAQTARASLSQASTETIGTIERSLATRDALSADVAILCQRVYDLQKNLTGAVRDARQATIDARTIELKPTRRRKATSTKGSSAKARPIRRRKAA
jgi:hypothetical protein